MLTTPAPSLLKTSVVTTTAPTPNPSPATAEAPSFPSNKSSPVHSAVKLTDSRPTTPKPAPVVVSSPRLSPQNSLRKPNSPLTTLNTATHPATSIGLGSPFSSTTSFTPNIPKKEEEGKSSSKLSTNPTAPASTTVIISLTFKGCISFQT